MADELQHTDALDLRAFEILDTDAKLREIWLNGRETNGRVAQAVRDIEEAKVERATIASRVAGIEHNWTQAKAVLAFVLIFVAPVMLVVTDLIVRAIKGN